MSEEKTLRARDYLDHILQAILRIDRYTDDMTEASFLEDEKTQDAVVRNIEIIGEAAKNVARIDLDFARQHDEIAWGEFI